MADVCLSLKLLLNQPEFQKLQKEFPNMRPAILKTRLERYRSIYGLDIDWFPTDEFIAAFRKFNYNQNRLAKLQKAHENMKQESNGLVSKYMAALSAFNNAQLSDAVDYLVTGVETEIDTLSEYYPGSTRGEVMEAAGGFADIMDRVFDAVSRMKKEDIYQSLVNNEGGEANLSEARKMELDSDASRIMYERQNLLDYKKHLAVRVANKLSELEGFKFEYEGLLVDWKDEANSDTVSNDDEAGRREDGESKGSRYVDFRELELQNTLSPKTKRFIGSIPMVDENGKPVLTIFGTQRMMDYQQVAITLLNVLHGTSPETFLSKIKDATSKYPWMQQLYDKLVAEPEMQATIYSNCSRAFNRYATIYLKNREYRYGKANSTAKDYSVIRHMFANMVNGTSLNSKYRIYDGDGNLNQKVEFSDEEILAISAIDDIECRPNKGPVDNPKYNERSFRTLTGREAWDELEKRFPNVFAIAAECARGVGLDVTEEDMRRVAYSDMPTKTKDFKNFRNRLSALMSGISGIRGQATHYETADELFGFVTTESKKINFAMAQAMQDEVETRVRLNNKTISALSNTNLVHIVSDIITNEDGLSLEAYKDRLQNEFLQYEGYTLADKPVGWLANLYNEKYQLPTDLALVQCLQFNNVEYEKMSDQQKALSSYYMWKHANAYEIPIQADYSTSYEFMQVPESWKFDTKDQLFEVNEVGDKVYNLNAPIINAFADEVLVEIERMDAIRERASDDTRIELKTYEEQGLNFNVFPEFNNNGFEAEYRRYLDAGKSALALDFLKKSIAEQLTKIVDRDVETFRNLKVENNDYALNDLTVVERDANDKAIRVPNVEAIREYSLNEYYGRIQLTKLLTGGFAHFPNITEFEKRCMFLHAPHTSLYTPGSNNNDVNQHVLYVGDDETKSAYIDYLTSLADEAYHQKKITEYQHNEYIRAYSSIKSTDGMGLRTPDSYINVMKMMGEDTSELEAAHNRIKQGNHTKKDIDLFLYAGQKLVGAGFEHIPAAIGTNQKPVKNPFLHKYSEIVMLPPEILGSTMTGRSEYMKGFFDAQEELNSNGVNLDLILFNSNVKIGLHSPLNPLEIKNGERVHKSADDIKNYLVSKVQSDPNRYVHTIPWKYYGKAASMPTDVANTRIVMPTQAEKALFSNILPGDTVNLLDKDGNPMSTEMARDEYNDLKTADVIDAYNEVREILSGDQKQLEKLFQTEIASRGYSHSDVMYALSLLENGQFAIPLCAPSVAKQVQEMLYSIINKRMTRPHVKGAHMHQMTALGLDNSEAPFAYSSDLSKEDLLGLRFKKNGEFGGVETFLPFFDNRLKIFADENGVITPKRLRHLQEIGAIPEKFLEYYGLRTPSDDIHSVIPLYIKGFSANVGGASLAMSKEGMVMTGGDFDGDEFHCFFKDFTIAANYDRVKKLYDSRKWQDENGNSISLEDFWKSFSDKKGKFLRNLKRAGVDYAEYFDVVIDEYDDNLTALQNERTQRNNRRNELIFATLTSKSSVAKLFMPNSNAETDVQAKTTYIMQRLAADDNLESNLADAITEWNNEHEKDKISVNFSSRVALFDSLMKLSVKQINKLYESVSRGQSPYSFTYALEAYRRVMGGASMIDIYAMNASAHQMLQRAGLYYNEKTKKSGERIQVTLFGNHRIGQLFPVKSDETDGGSFTTLAMASLLQSAVDNNKNPILGLLNQYAELAELTSFLCAAGFSQKRIHLLLNQPVMVELAKRLKEYESEGFDNEAKKLLINLEGFVDDETFTLDTYKALERVAGYKENTYIEAMPDSFEAVLKMDEDKKRVQADLLRTFIYLYPAANMLADVIKTTRPESHSATIGPTIARTATKYSRILDLREKIFNSDTYVPIQGLDSIFQEVDTEGMSDEQLFESTESPIHHVSSLNALMYDQAMGWLQKYFPQARESWYNLALKIAKRYRYRQLHDGSVTEVFNDMITWKLLHHTEFINDIEARRDDLINKLPDRLKAIKKRIRDAKSAMKSGGEPTDKVAASLADNMFLNLLGTQKIKTDGSTRILFRPGGPVTANLQDRVMNDWGDLMLNENEEVRQLAVDLYMYNFINNGFRFGMYEFAHLAPVTVLWNIPGLSESLNSILSDDFVDGSYDTENFEVQFYMNHWHNDKLVPTVDIDNLPNGLREHPFFGLHSVINDKKQKTESLESLKKSGYVLVRRIDPDITVKNRKKITELYKLVVNDNGTVTPVKISKLGKKGTHGQVYIQYNPFINWKDIQPFKRTSKEEENASAGAVRQAQQSYGNNRPVSLQDLVNQQDSTPASKPPTLVETIGLKQQIEAKQDEVVAANAQVLSEHPEDIPGAFDEPVFEHEDGFDEERQQYHQNPDSSEVPDMTSPTPEERATDTVEEGQGPVIEDKAGKPLDRPSLLSDLGLNNNKKMPYLSLIKREGTDVSVVKVPVTPNNIREARKIEAYKLLNERLKKILSDAGVGISALNEMDARLMMAGVSDFDTTKITAQGIADLIRVEMDEDGNVIGEGIKALPEEFSHVVIEMLGHDHPLVARLLNSLEQNEPALREAFGDQYDDYVSYYRDVYLKDNPNSPMTVEQLMALEAAGKLLAKSLFRQQQIETRGIRGLINRIKAAWANFKKRFSPRQFERAILESEGIASELAQGLLSGQLADELDKMNIVMSGKMAQKVRQDITEKNDIVSKLHKIELKRLQVLQKRLAYRKNNGQNASVAETEKQIAMLEEAIKNHKVESAIYSYMKTASDFLAETEKSLLEDINNGKKANTICKKISIIHDVIYSYKLAMQEVRDAINNGEIANDESMNQARSALSHQLADLLDNVDRLSLIYFQGTLREFYGEDGVEITLGKDKGRRISIEEMSTKGDKDISIISRWVHSMGDCNDLVLKAVDGIVKKAKFNARKYTDAAMEQINVAFETLKRETGSMDQTFMFEYDSEGHKTGKFISKKASESLSVPQKKYYDTMMSLKKQLDRLLPESKADNEKIVMLRKTSLQKAKEANSASEKGKHLWESIRNIVMDTSDSVDYDHFEVEMDFEGNRIDKLPILYCAKGKNESYDDMVDDVATAMLAYAGMANEYYQLNNVIGEIENARYMSARRQIAQRAGNKPLRETVSNDDVIFHQDYTNPQWKTNIQLVFEDFMQMHVYGHLRRNEGNFGNTKISKRKVADTLNAATAYSQLAINLPQRIANVTVGEANVIIHAASKNSDFNMKDMFWARGQYMKHTPQRLLDTGSLDSNDKLSLFRERFDVGQENGRQFKNAKYQKGKLARVFNTNLLYAGLMAGEDYLSSVTALSMAHRYQVLDDKGHKTNLWEAYDVKYIDEANKTGAYLAIKDGYRNLDGSEITREDELKFANKVASVNFDLQGIYNQDDKAAIQSVSLGSIIMMYRKWIAPAIKRRYGEVHYDHLKERYEEGYWRTTGRLLWDDIYNTIKTGENILAVHHINVDKLNDYEKSNIHKAITEACILFGCVASIMLLEKLPPDDDKKDKGFLTWADQMLLYQIYRLRNELGAQAPTPLFIREAMKMLESPFAAVEPLKNMLNIYKFLLPSSYTDEIKRGTYKGHTTAYKTLWSLPILSMTRQVHRLLDPSSMILFYRNGN